MDILSHGCTLDCFDCCKFNVYREGNEVMKIEGDKNHPFTKGFICNKGRAHLNRLNHKERILKPLLKINGEWKEISFEDSLELMKENLERFKKEYSSRAILYYSQYGSGGVLKGIEDVFFNFYGGVSKAEGEPCWSAGMRAQKYDFGNALSHNLEDMLNSKSIFLWGKNPAHTTIHTLNMLNKAKKNGSRIIVIDPIKTQSAKLSDIHISIKPGTDGALALAMAKVIIDNKLYDKEYINNNVLGFNEFKEYIDGLGLNYLSEECGVDIEDIVMLTKYYCEKNSSIYLGYGIQKYKNGGNAIRAIDALGAITGQIGVLGGGVNYANKIFPKVLNGDPFNSSDLAENREFYVSYINEFIDNPSEYNLSSDNDNTPIKMLVIANSNLVNQLPDLNRLTDSFSKIEFKVCFDMFMTDTAKLCDLIIPCSNTLESEDLIYSSMTNPYIIYNEKVVEPQNFLMDEYFFFMELAKIMKIEGYPKISKKEYLEKVIEPLKEFDKNISLESLKNDPFTIQNEIPWRNGNFETTSKKFELTSERAFKECGSLLPIYIPNDLGEDVERNMFRLLTNHSKNSLSSQHYLDKCGISEAYINKHMMDKLNLEEGEIISLRSINGEIDVIIKSDDGVRDRVILMYVGWWKKHGNPNYLTNSGISDIGGQITYNETFVEIKKK
ncbi:molybdopterin-dependent oxidoreductase [Clostridium sp. B9]|uniref:molybdopterin-dependent oxidoreductase n=1 Tax=Clostridium sp. B9 TaxID=3423224 RepID=UPI003D2EDDC7